MILKFNNSPTPRDIAFFAILLAPFFGVLGGIALWRPEALVGASIMLSIAWLVSLIINRNDWRLQILGAAMPLMFFAIGGSIEAGAKPWTVIGATWTIGLVLAVVSWSRPKLGRRLYQGWMLAAFPIGWSISHLILGITYYLVFTPIGQLMRVLGRDPMHRKIDRDAPTYWVKHDTPADSSRYFQKF